MPDTSNWTKWLTQPGHIRAVSLEGTALVHHLCEQQKLTGAVKQGYAEAIVGALLIASAHKSNESINLNAQGSALYKQALIDASPEGRVRGFIKEQSDTSLHTFGEHGTNGPWGSGILSVLYTKNFAGKIPYTGMVPIASGYLDEAINEYYRDSEQLTSKIGLSVKFAEGRIQSARGVLVQALGGASEIELLLVNDIQVSDLRRLAEEMPDSNQAGLKKVFPSFNWEVTENARLDAFCTCSQERIERALLLTGENDIIEALGEDPLLEITCDFCKTRYEVSAERVKALFSPSSSRLQ